MTLRPAHGCRLAAARRATATVAATGLAPAVAASGYLLGLTALAWRAHAARADHTVLPDEPSTAFAVLIPAHNEAQLIAGTVRDILRADYPGPMLAVHVVADNCSDATAALARGAGATVHEHTAQGGKGAALQWALTQITERDAPDAFVIVDADTHVDARALRVLDAHLARGEQVVQAHYAVQHPSTSPATALRAAALAVRHYLRPLARTTVGGTSGLFGNGMAFRSDVLRDRRWSSHLTEDIEFQIDLLLTGVRVGFAPDAVVRAEMPDTFAAANSQNERWERGRIDLLKRHARTLVTCPGRGRAARLDTLVDLALPPFSVLTAVTTTSAAIGFAVGRRRSRWVLAGGFALGAQAAYLFSGLRLTNAPRAVYWALLRAPRAIVWKLALWARVATRTSEVAWTRTARNQVRADA